LLAPTSGGGYYRLVGRSPSHKLIDTTAGTTRDRAEAKAVRLAAAYRGEGGRLADKPFEKLVASYLDPASHDDWGPRRAGDVGDMLRNHLPATIRRTPCAELRKEQFVRLLNTLRSENYAPNTVAQIGSVLRGIVTYGIENDYFPVGRDPMRGVKYSIRSSSTSEDPLWVPFEDRPSLVQADDLAAALSAETGCWWWELATKVASRCGLRWGELIALRAEDIDLTEQLIHVDWQLAEHKGKHTRRRPKNNKRRVVPYPDFLHADLVKRIAEVQQAAGEMYRGGASKSPHGLLFCGTRGTEPRRSNFNRRALTPARLAAGWPAETWNDDGVAYRQWRWGWHSLRHAAASWYLSSPANGGLGLDPADAAKMLGHSVPVLMRMYVQPPADFLDTARDRMNRAG
jgi:integrase